jgi:hypothetical protein
MQGLQWDYPLIPATTREDITISLLNVTNRLFLFIADEWLWVVLEKAAAVDM